VGVGVGPAQPATPSARDSFAIMAEVDRMAAQPLWPGFDLGRIPVALYDGQRTVLFRHAQPGEGFVASANHPGVWIAEGLHASVRGNTSADIGGVLTAVVMLDSLREAYGPREHAGVVTHEAFHVFQRTQHKDWGANEASLFTYPVDNAELLQLRRLESEALRRALAAGTEAERRAWAALAMQLRRERFGALDAAAVAYERGTEKIEGLAQAVQAEALGTTEGLLRLAPEEFAPEAVRARGYSTGLAIAVLLGPTDPGWKAKLESGQVATLDELLGAALVDVRPAELAPAERERALARARADVSALSSARDKRRAEFLGQEGWRVEIVAAAKQPLQVQGFDPMNVERLSAQEVLHGRWIALTSPPTGRLEVLDRRSLTRAAGSHPLFSGVASLTVTGLAQEPEVTIAGDQITLRAEGLTAELRNARLVREGRSLTVELGAAERQ
jgi:hypothetical protein